MQVRRGVFREPEIPWDSMLRPGTELLAFLLAKFLPCRRSNQKVLTSADPVNTERALGSFYRVPTGPSLSQISRSEGVYFSDRETGWDSMLRPGTQLLAFLLAKFVPCRRSNQEVLTSVAALERPSQKVEPEGRCKPTGLPQIRQQPCLELLTQRLDAHPLTDRRRGLRAQSSPLSGT
jgi:hypothetical protein